MIQIAAIKRGNKNNTMTNWKVETLKKIKTTWTLQLQINEI